MPQDDGALEELRDACNNGDITHIRQLFAQGRLDADDASEAVEMNTHDPALIRCLLENGADPAIAEITLVESGEVLRLLTKFGYDIKSHGHLVLQSACLFDLNDKQLADALVAHLLGTAVLSTGCLTKVSISTAQIRVNSTMVSTWRKANLIPRSRCSTTWQQRGTSNCLTTSLLEGQTFREAYRCIPPRSVGTTHPS